MISIEMGSIIEQTKEAPDLGASFVSLCPS